MTELVGVEAWGVVAVEGVDRVQLGWGEFEVEDGEVFGLAFRVAGAWDGDAALLQVPAQDYLGGGFAVFFADAGQRWVGEEFAAAAEWRVGGVEHVVFGVEVLDFGLRAVRVDGNLVDLWGEAGVEDPLEVVWFEVGDTPVADFAFGAEVFEALAGFDIAVLVWVRPVDEVEVDGVEAEAGEGAFECLPDFGAAVPLFLEFGGEEVVVTVEAARAEAGADGVFVFVGFRGVDVAVAELEGVADGLGGFRALERPRSECERWDLSSVGGGQFHARASVREFVRSHSIIKVGCVLGHIYFDPREMT